jgi:hypothetical protein
MVFAACGFMTARRGRPLQGAMWLPTDLLYGPSIASWRSFSSVALAGISFAMPVLAGHPKPHSI